MKVKLTMCSFPCSLETVRDSRGKLKGVKLTWDCLGSGLEGDPVLVPHYIMEDVVRAWDISQVIPSYSTVRDAQEARLCAFHKMMDYFPSVTRTESVYSMLMRHEIRFFINMYKKEALR